MYEADTFLTLSYLHFICILICIILSLLIMNICNKLTNGGFNYAD